MKKFYMILLFVFVIIGFISLFLYMGSIEPIPIDNPYSYENDGQWFAVNHSFIHVYKWEDTESGWRFYFEEISFENMTGSHLIIFPDDGDMWLTLPSMLVRNPNKVYIVQPVNTVTWSNIWNFEYKEQGG